MPSELEYRTTVMTIEIPLPTQYPSRLSSSQPAAALTTDGESVIRWIVVVTLGFCSAWSKGRGTSR